MCQLAKKDFFSAKRCRDLLIQWLREDSDIFIIVNRLFESQYDVNYYKYVLAATVLEHKYTLGYNFSEKTVKWAEKYKTKIGFLAENIRIYPYSVKKIENLILLVLRRTK